MDHLLYFLIAVTVFFTLLIFFAIFYFAIKYRRRSANELPDAGHTGYTLEILWSVIPFGITMVMFTWGASVFFNVGAAARRLDPDLRGRQAVDVEAAAHGGCRAKSTNCTSRWAARSASP